MSPKFEIMTSPTESSSGISPFEASIVLADIEARTGPDDDDNSLLDDTEISSLADESIQRIEFPPEQQQQHTTQHQRFVELATSPPQEVVVPIKPRKKEGHSPSQSYYHRGRRFDSGEDYLPAVEQDTAQHVLDVQFSSTVSTPAVMAVPTIYSSKSLSNRLSASNLLPPTTVGFVPTQGHTGTLSSRRVSFASGFEDLHIPVHYEVTASDLGAEDLLGERPRHTHRRVRSGTTVSIGSIVGQSVVTATTTVISPSSDPFALDFDYICQEPTVAVKDKRRLSKSPQNQHMWQEDEEEEFRSTARSLQRKHSRRSLKQMVGKVSSPIRCFKRGMEESAELNRSKGCLV